MREPDISLDQVAVALGVTREVLERQGLTLAEVKAPERHAAPADIEHAIETWARWARDRRGVGGGRCRSAEGRYAPERLAGDTEADRRTAREPLDVRLAVNTFKRINPALGDFPALFYLVLTAEYVLRLEPHAMRGYLRRHGHLVARADLELLVRRAVAEAARRLA